MEDMLPGDMERILRVNCLFTMQLTTLLLPQIKASAGRRGVVTSRMAMPMLSVYAATKAFLDHWALNLAAELQAHGIEVTCLRPGLTATRMSGIETPSLMAPTARHMAQACTRLFGSRLLGVAPYWPHALLDVINEWVPAYLGWPIVRKMHEEKRLELLAKEIVRRS